MIYGMQDFHLQLHDPVFKSCYENALNNIEIDDTFDKNTLELDLAVYSDAFWYYTKIVIVDDKVDQFPSIQLCELIKTRK